MYEIYMDHEFVVALDDLTEACEYALDMPNQQPDDVVLVVTAGGKPIRLVCGGEIWSVDLEMDDPEEAVERRFSDDEIPL